MPERRHPYRPLLLVAFAAVLLVALPCHAAHVSVYDPALKRILRDGVLRVGVNPQFEPFSYTLNTERRSGADKFIRARVGIDIDIAVLLARELRVALDIIVPNRFDQLIPMLQTGEIDIAIAALSRVFERALLVDFSDPYYISGFSILLNLAKGYRIGIGEAQSYGDLKTALAAVNKEDQLIVAVTQGKSAVGFIGDYFPQAQILQYETNELAAEAVLSDSSDTPHLMVHDEIFLKLWNSQRSWTARQKLVVFPKPFRSDTYGFAVAKGNLDFIQVLNLFIADKLISGERMEAFKQRRHHRYIPGIGIEAIVPEESEHGKN